MDKKQIEECRKLSWKKLSTDVEDYVNDGYLTALLVVSMINDYMHKMNRNVSNGKEKKI